MLTPRDTASLHRLMSMLNDPEKYKEAIGNLIKRQEEVNASIETLQRQEVDTAQKFASLQGTIAQIDKDKRELREAVNFRSDAIAEIDFKNADLDKRKKVLDAQEARLDELAQSLNARQTKLTELETDITHRVIALSNQEATIRAKLSKLRETEAMFTKRMEKLKTFVEESPV